MATSGSVNYTVTRDDIITEALELLGRLANGDTVGTNDATSCARTLNMFVKHLQSRGVAFWKSKEITIFLQDATSSYTLGPTGTSPATVDTVVKTELAAAASSGASTITVDSITGISSGDVIGVEMDDGTLHWTTVNGAPSGTTVTLTAATDDDASVDANVYAYTTGINRPLFLTELRLHEDGGTEIPMRLVSRNEYKRMSLKTTEGKPTMAWYDPQRTDGVLYIWPRTSSVKDYLVATARMPLEDFDAGTDDADFPQEWFLALAYNLALLAAPKFDLEISPSFRETAGILLQDAMDSAADYGSLYIEVTGE